MRKFAVAIDAFIADFRAEGRIRSEHTERAYRECLMLHGEDIGWRSPAKTGKADVKRTLARWEHPNTRIQKHAILRSELDFDTTELRCALPMSDAGRLRAA